MSHGRKLEAKDAVVCKVCGRVDINDYNINPHHIGTRRTMVCYDCGEILNDAGHPQASMCRNCCPTGHGTK